LVQYTPDGTAKAEILPPPDLASGFYPVSVEWLENDLFLVSYKNANGDEDEPLSVFIIHRNKEEMTYTEFFDPLNTMGLPHRSASHRSIASLKQWGDQTRHLAFMLSGKSSEVGVMRGRVAAGKEAPVWESLILEETARGVMPTGKTGVSEDSSCMGLELDLTSTKPIKMGIVGGIEVPDLPPAPRLLAYSQEGFIISFDIRYTDAGAYPNMVTPQETPSSASTAEVSMDTSAPTASESVPPVKPAFGATQSTFGSTSSPSPSPSAFGSSTTPSIGFGQSAFGKPSTAPGFGQTAFGQPAAKSSSPSPFGQSTPSFGQTGFGQKTETKSAFGSASPSTSASPFGQAASTSAFGQSAGSTSAFGKPAFGGSATPAFGQTAFGAPSPSASPAFGASAFGTPSTPAKSPFGQTQTQAQGSTTPSATPPASAPAFGQTAFGQKPTTATTPAFGQTSTAQPTAFGQTAFGQPSKPTAFGQPAISTSSAFGSVPSTGGFAGFGAPKASGQTSSGFGASAFGQHKPQSTADSPFGSGGAVKTGSGSGSSSAFGSSSGFGQSAFGSGSGSKSAAPTNPFGKPADKVEPKKDSPLSGSTTPTAGTTGGFGLGGLGSALASSSSSIPSTKDGADSLFAPSAKIAQDPRITSPPDSPVLGATKAAGSEDDSPPPTPKSNPKPSAASSSNSFIKPATAFGTTFGQSTTPTSTPAKPISGSGTPNAFSQPVSTSTSTTPSASGFGSTGFGSSAFGKPATPGFGGSAFGKPHSTTPVGNITGGFGGFAAKSPSSSSGFSGFGATKSTSAFGSTGSGSGGSFASLLIGDKEKPKESLERSKSLSGEFTPPTLAKAEAEKVEVKEEPKEVEVEDSSEQPPTPVGYDVPSTTPAGAVKPTEEKGEEEDVKPDITSDELVSGTTPPSIDATEAHAPASAQTEPEEGDDNQDRAGSSPEIVDHADSEEPEHDDEQEHDNDDEGREEDVEDAEEYDEDGEEGEEYDEEVEGEGEYEEGEEDNYDDEEQYDENDREDYEDYEGEGEGEHEVEDEEREEGEAEVEAEQPQDPAEKASTPTDQTPGSLFSRLAPPSNPSFFGRHAARTSSPLGTQPPQNAEAESSTPPGTPPTKSAFRDASSSAPPPFFGFNKTQAGPELKVPTPVAFGSDNKTSLPSFGKSTSSEVGQASTTPAQSVQAKQPEKPLFSGFGLGRPSSPAQSPTPAPASQPFMFNKPQTPAVPSPAPSTPTAQPPAPSLFGQKPQPAPATPATPATPAVKPVADGKFAVPARTPVKESPQAQDDGSRQMAAVMQRMITDLISEIKTVSPHLLMMVVADELDERSSGDSCGISSRTRTEIQQGLSRGSGRAY
jgi:nucleoporin NUP159